MFSIRVHHRQVESLRVVEFEQQYMTNNLVQNTTELTVHFKKKILIEFFNYILKKMVLLHYMK